ncbi:MAG: leucine-rich repeat protein, partial [Eubacteriales bacterium]
MKNNTSYKRTVRMLAAFLTVTTLVVSLPLTAFAQRQTDGTQTLSQDEVPDFMELDELLEQGMTDRIYESDDLYSYIFENADGERTLYRYSVPVRYVDEYGVVRDKSTDIAEYTDGSFRTVASDILTVFGERIADGICLSDSDYALMLTPVAANDALAFLSADSKTVTYMIDEHTRYEYSLTAMGFKEDIIVESYTGQTEYEFDLDTNGLALVDQFGTYVLADEDGTVCGSLSDIIIFTADERNNTYGEMSVETVVENEQYRLTVRLDDAWLSDANTAYPITIDPSITLTASGDIEDIVVGTSTTYSADSGSLYVGRGSSGAKLRTLMRFPGLNIDGYYVTEAVVTLRDLMCQDVAQTVECHKFTGNSWSESSGTSWSGVGNDMVGSLLSTQVVSYSNGVDSMHASVHRYEFDITSLARQWAAGTCSPESGILFKATDDYEVNGTKTFKTFASINRSSNNPTLYIRYSKALGVNGSYTYSTQTLDNNVSGSVSHSMGNLNSVYSFDIYDSDFPLEVAYVFNSNLVGQQYLSYYGYNYSTYFGYGWKLSLYELLFKDSTANAYIYVDSYGTEYSFPYDAETGLYTNDGLDLSVTIDDTSLKLNPGDGITRTFNSDGFVSSIEMDDEVYTYVYDSTSNYRLTAITDESGDTDLSFTYNSTGFLTGVDGKYTISYGSSRVSSIADNYSNIHTYSYGSTYFNVRNDDTLYGYYYTLSSATMQVSVIRNYRSSTTYVLERDDITYAENKTTYANSLCDYLSVYHFDDEGRTVNALRTSEDGTTIYYAEAYAYEPAYDTTGTYFFSGGMPFNRSNYVNSSNYVYSSFYQGSKTLNSGAQNSITSSVNCHKVLYLTGLLQLGSAVGQDDTVLTIELIYSNTTFGSDILTFPVNNLITDQQYFCYEIYPKESVASVIVTFYNPATASTSFQYVSLVGGDSLADSSTEEESTATRYSSGLSYTVLTSKTCSITGIGSCTDTDLVIPEYMGGKYKVTQIAGEAFKNNTSVTSVLLPDTVKRIGNKAFYGCSSLQTIDLSYELTYIGADAFRNCTSLTSIDIPNKVTFVGDHAFNSCESLSEVSLSNGLTELTEYVFSECYDITYINMPKSIKTLGVGAFYHIDNLKVYYEGTSAEWNAVTKGTAALTSTSTVYAQSEYYDNFRYTYTTDQNGNITSTTITYVGDEETSDTVRFTSATYDANGNLLSYTDERGNTTSYTYDEYGNTTSVTDAKGTTTYYTYTKGVLTGIWQESGIHIYYDYTNGLLTAIRVIKGSDYSQSYNFTYNSFGKLTQVSLNTSPYIRYTYQNGGAGALTGVTYQNSDYEQYTYDMMGNVSSVKVNGTTRYTYVYDYMGNLLSGSDVQTTIVDTCKYDRLGTMVSRTQTVNGTTVYTIDEDGSYTFADGAVTPDVGSEESYDVWDRITSSALTLTVDETTNTVYTVAYTYLASANSM